MSTMTVLTNIQDCLGDEVSLKEYSRDEALDDVLSRLQMCYMEAHTDLEAYMAPSSVIRENAILGSQDPGKIKSIALRWNENIAVELLRTVKEFICANSSTGSLCHPDDLEAHCITLDTPEIYALKGAAMAADNCWHDFANQMTYLRGSFGQPCFAPILSAVQLARITENPENFIVVDIPIKC